MASKRDIKATLKLEGEHEFRKGMKDAQDAIKAIAAEEKLAKAQFEATGDAQAYAAERARLLKDKIAEQEKAVAAAEAAVKKLTENGLKPGDKRLREWTLKTVAAKTQLLNMQTALNKVETEIGEQATALTGEGGLEPALEETGDAAGETGEQLRQIGQGVNYQNAISAIDDISSHIGSLLSGIGNAAKALWDMEATASDWADELTTAAARAQMDPVTYQSWQYASQFIDTSVDDIVAARGKITTALADTSGDAAKLFNILNVPTRNEDGTVRSADEVLWDVVDALGAIEDPTQRAITAQQLLGESWTSLQPLIDAGSASYKALAAEGEDVAAVTQENVDKLLALDDQRAKLDSASQKAARTIQAGLAPGFQSLAEAATKAFEAFNKYLESEEGQAVLERLSNSVGGLVGSLTEEDIAGLVETAAGAITKVIEGMGWLLDHQAVVVGAVGALAAAWGGLKIARSVLTVLQLISSIKWLQVGAGAGKLGQALGNMGAGGSSGGSSDGGLGDVGKVFTDAHDEAPSGNESGTLRRLGHAALSGIGKVAEFALGPAAAVTGPAAGFVGAYALGRYLEQTSTEQMFGPALEAAAAADEVRAVEAAGDERIARMQALYDELLGVFDRSDPFEQYETYKSRRDELAQLLPGADFGANDKWYEEPNGLYINEYEQVIGNALAALAESIRKNGEQTSAGFGEGIAEGAPGAEQAATDMAAGIDEAVRGALEIESPSKVMSRNGEHVAEGLAAGIRAKTASAVAAAQSLAAAVAAAMSGVSAPSLGALRAAPVYPGMLSAQGRQAAMGGAGPAMMTTNLNINGRTFASAVTPYMDVSLAAVPTRR